MHHDRTSTYLHRGDRRRGRSAVRPTPAGNPNGHRGAGTTGSRTPVGRARRGACAARRIAGTWQDPPGEGPGIRVRYGPVPGPVHTRSDARGHHRQRDAETRRRTGATGLHTWARFGHLLLVDELNRATPKTQSALLEAMQERQVTQGGHSHALPRPFWVVATQNPIEVEGTYPLPEAQLDRFLMKLRVAFPDAEALLDMLAITLDDEPAEHLKPVLDRVGVMRLMAMAAGVVIADPVRRAAVDLILATHPERGREPGSRGHIRYGASPRALQSLLRAARVRALAQSRVHVGLDDLAATAPGCLRHRVLLTVEAELSGEEVDVILGRILTRWRGRW